MYKICTKVYNSGKNVEKNIKISYNNNEGTIKYIGEKI